MTCPPPCLGTPCPAPAYAGPMTAAPGPGPPDYAWLSADDLVTGEAVALDLPAANLATRMASGLVDLTVTLVVALVVVFGFGLATSRSGQALAWVGVVGASIVILLVVPTTVETLTRGRSLGKLALGLRVVRDDAGPTTFQHAFVRALVGVVEIYGLTGAPAFFSALLSTRGKRLGDYAAGTYVVRERVRLRLPPPARMPAALSAWAAGADLAPLPAGLALAVRQLLARAQEVPPAIRLRLAAELAAQVAPYVAPAPPPGTSPEDVLAAVMAARRERDLQRLGREADLRRRLTGHRHR